ncbi:hypothetical protein EI94DRAFT_1730491 [Lactarius quietus]|nr:hypothetical protein EI94DRAFT_1730491 [Lactarius quietus]
MLARGDTTQMDDSKITLSTSLWRNASSPSLVALQLPVELLQKVFLFLVELPYARKLIWIAITYVCRYWRSAALGLRELWSSITPYLSMSWSWAMIERSAPLPMRVHFLVGYSSIETYRLAASELLSASRMRTLSLAGYPNNVLDILNRICGPSPLESLSLRFPDMGGPIGLPGSLYGGDMPHLRRLTFNTMGYIRAPLWLLAGITHFTHNSCASLDDLIRMLEAMPQLEELCIGRNFGHQNEPDPHPHERLPPRHTLTTLSRLSLLSIRDRIPQSFLILSSCIDAPPTLRRHFFWKDEAETWPRWDWTLEALQSFIPGDSTLGANDGGLRIAQICGHECNSFEVWSRTYSERASAGAREDALFLLHVEWSDRDPDDSSFPNPSLFFSSAAHIEDLTIAPEPRIEGGGTASESETDTLIIVERWTEMLTDLPSVKTLRLLRGSYGCVSVLRALSDSQAPILSHLKGVIVVNSAIHSESAAPACLPDSGKAGAGCSVICREFVQANVGMELMRAVRGRSGLEVVLAGCEVDEEMLDVLRNHARVYIGYERVYV